MRQELQDQLDMVKDVQNTMLRHLCQNETEYAEALEDLRESTRNPPSWKELTEVN